MNLKNYLAALLCLVFLEPVFAKTALRPWTETRLSNGLRVLLIEDRSLPYFSLGLLIKTGATSDPTAKKGLSWFVSGLLEKGTAKRSATNVADELGSIGSEFSNSTDNDFVYFSAGTLTKHREELLDVFSDIMVNPAFGKVEVERFKKQALAQLQQMKDRPESFAELVFEKLLYGKHPYAWSAIGTQKTVRAIERADITRHFQKYYRPENAWLAVVGQLGPDVQARLEATLGKWVKKEVSAEVLAHPAPLASRKILLVHKADLTQAQIRIGQIGIRRGDPDFMALRLANVVLGAGFSSRLMDEIRDNLGLTYGISSSFDARLVEGPFEISTFTRNEKAEETVRRTLEIVDKFRSAGLTEEELKAAKGQMKGIFPKAIETAEALASNLLRLRIYGVPDSYLTDFIETVDGLSRAKVNEAIQKHLDPAKMLIVVYANKDDVLAQLQKLGAVEVMNASEFE